MAYRRALLALAACVLVTACGGGSPCEDYCAEAKDCENMSLVPGEDCAKSCEEGPSDDDGGGGSCPNPPCDPCAAVDCAECGPSIEGTVRDATSAMAVSGATVTASGQACDVQEDGSYGCSAPVGTHTLTTEAAAYAPTTIMVTVSASDGEGCCDCGYETTTADIELSPPPPP
jgi:hypothetical protein